MDNTTNQIHSMICAALFDGAHGLEHRRRQLTFLVDAGHEGEPIIRETPSDGYVVECSPDFARTIHVRYWLRLTQINNPWQAEFVPVAPTDGSGDLYSAPPWNEPEARSWISTIGSRHPSSF